MRAQNHLTVDNCVTSEPHAIVHDVQIACAHSTQTVFRIMAAVLAATFLVAVRGLPRGGVQPVDEQAAPVPERDDLIGADA